MNHCVVRQAIRKMNQDKILGYELVFQDGGEGLYGESQYSAADTISGFLMNNSEKIFKSKQIFLTFTPTLLLRNTPKIFQKDKVIIQIGDNLVIHPLATPIIEKYYKEGYRFAINDFQFSPKYFSMLEYVEYIRLRLKTDMTAKERASLENIIHMAKSFGKKCILTNVDTKELYETAQSLEADYVEGNYIAETFSVKADKIEYLQGNFFQLVVAVSREEPDMDEIEEIISRDAGLSYSLLKLINSAYFALRKRTASIRLAIMTMGINQMRQWVYMLSLKGGEGEGADEILRLSFLRAKFAEALSQNTKRKILTPSEAYMMGMFSTLEYMVDAPLAELLEEIPISDEVKAALTGKEGDAGSLQKLVICYEKADWKMCQELAEKLEIPVSKLSQIYIDCVEEVSWIWSNLTTECHRPGEDNMFKDEDDREKLEDVLRYRV